MENMNKSDQAFYDNFVNALIEGLWKIVAVLFEGEDKKTVQVVEPGPNHAVATVSWDDIEILPPEKAEEAKRLYGYIPMGKPMIWHSGMLGATLVLGWVKLIWVNEKSREAFVFTLDGTRKFMKVGLSELRALTKYDREEIVMKKAATELDWFRQNQEERERIQKAREYDREISNNVGYRLKNGEEMKFFATMIGGCDSPVYQGPVILLRNKEGLWRVQAVNKDNTLGQIVDGVEEQYLRYLGRERVDAIMNTQKTYIMKLRDLERQASQSVPMNRPKEGPRRALSESEKAERRQRWAEGEKRRLSGTSTHRGKKSIPKPK